MVPSPKEFSKNRPASPAPGVKLGMGAVSSASSCPRPGDCGTLGARVHLVILHHHYRPGGVRRVIELAAPLLAQAAGGALTSVTLAGGEAPAEAWLGTLERALPGVPLRLHVEPSFGYWDEQQVSPPRLAERMAASLARLIEPADETVIWAHNAGLGRHPLLFRELARAATDRRVRLLLHHHDWWVDSRWHRWAEMRQAGVRTLGQAAATAFPPAVPVQHLTINQADARVLRRHLPGQVTWVPNPAQFAPPPSATRVRAANRWLRDQLRRSGPVWLLPCRLLRRKNVAEALLLTRWLRPEAWLVTTGGPSSADEQAYADTLADAAQRCGWPLRLGILRGAEADAPAVPELMAASEAVLLTSLQEGFGLPFLEAARAERPLLCRRLPNIAPDLRRFGFAFPCAYRELRIHPALFDGAGEQRRQARRLAEWRQRLPRACLPWAAAPPWLAELGAEPVPFSRLTLTAQLEVLTHPAEDSWPRCLPLNPWLGAWRRAAANGSLPVTTWPEEASRWLGPAATVARFRRALAAPKARVSAAQSRRVLDALVRRSLDPANQYPLLWKPEP